MPKKNPSPSSRRKPATGVVVTMLPSPRGTNRHGQDHAWRRRPALQVFWGTSRKILERSFSLGVGSGGANRDRTGDLYNAIVPGSKRNQGLSWSSGHRTVH